MTVKGSIFNQYGTLKGSLCFPCLCNNQVLHIIALCMITRLSFISENCPCIKMKSDWQISIKNCVKCGHIDQTLEAQSSK